MQVEKLVQDYLSSSFVHTIHKMTTTQISIYKIMDNQTVIYSYKGILPHSSSSNSSSNITT